MGNEIDDAFNWLILIMSTTNGALISLVETLEMKKLVAGGLLPPFFVLIIVWFLSYLVIRAHFKAILKTYAWFYASFMFLVILSIFADVAFPIMPILKFHVLMDFPLLIVLLLSCLFVGPFLFFDRLIRPIYREIYKDSRFLISRWRLVLLYGSALLTFLFLARDIVYRTSPIV